MLRIDFYIIQNDAPNAREVLACRLVEKAYHLGHQIYLHTDSQQQIGAMDNFLWTFRAGSFIPHQIYEASFDENCPVHIGSHDNLDEGSDVLINLADEVPSFFSRFERIAEIVDQDVTTRTNGRERFKFYRDRGFAIESHNI